MTRVLEDCTADGADLKVIYIVMPAEDTAIAHLGEQALIASSLLQEAAQELKHSALRVATARVEEISRVASERGLECTVDIVDGDFEELSVEVAADKRVKRMYVSGKNRSLLSRFLFGSEIARVSDAAECEVIVVEEGA